MYKKRLIATLVSIFALGVVFGILKVEYDTFSLRALFVALAAISVFFLILARRFGEKFPVKKVSAVAFAVAAFSFGVLRVSVYNELQINTNEFDGKRDYAEFQITEVNTYYVDAYVLSSEVGVKKGELVRVYSDVFQEGIVSGDRFAANVKYNFKNSNSNLADGISLTASADIQTYTEGKGPFYRIRKSISENSSLLYENFEFAPAISKAVAVGDRSSLDSYIFSLYKSSGISHVLAISGLHISLFAFNLYTIMMALGMRPKFVSIFSSLAAIGYAALVGYTPGAIRAASVFVFITLAQIFLRRTDEITAMFVTLGVLVLLNPYCLLSVGLQLSFLCSLGIMLSHPMIHFVLMHLTNKKREVDKRYSFIFKLAIGIALPFVVTMSSTFFSFPIICTSFDTVSYMSPLVNVIAVPLFSYGIGFALVALLIAPICLPFAKIIAYPAGALFDLVSNICERIHDNEIGNMSVHVSYMFIPIILSLCIICSLVFLPRRYILRSFVCTTILFCFSLYGCWLINNNYISTRVFVEYGDDYGEYVYCQSPNYNTYIDVGGYSSETDSVFKNGFVSLDRYVLLDYDAYSLKRFDRLGGSMKIGTLYLPNPQDSYEMGLYLQIKELAKQRNCDIIEYNEFYEENLSNGLAVEIFNDKDKQLIYITIDEKSVRFLGGNSDQPIYDDVAIAMSDFSGDVDNIYSRKVYASDGYIKAIKPSDGVFIRFKDTLRIEKHNQERQIEIYEP